MREQRVGDERVVDDDVGVLQRVVAEQRQQARRARAGADEPDRAGLERRESRARRVRRSRSWRVRGRCGYIGDMDAGYDGAMGKARVRILILGGTAEARELAERLDRHGPRDHHLARRTHAGPDPAARARCGSASSAASPGSSATSRRNEIDRLVDATHPYAGLISINAVGASNAAGVPLVRYMRPAWTRAGRRGLGARQRSRRGRACAAHQRAGAGDHRPRGPRRAPPARRLRVRGAADRGARCAAAPAREARGRRGRPTPSRARRR